MSNPYQTPVTGDPNSYLTPPHGGPADSLRPVGISLMVVAAISLACCSLALLGDVFLIASGSVERLEAMNNGPVSQQTTMFIRMTWTIVLIISSAYVAWGGWSMFKRQNYATARTASIVAAIPLLGPCCLLGVPFGIWGIIALGKPGVREAFVS